MQHRVLLLLTAQTYRAQPFIAAARRLGIEVVTAIDLPTELAERWGQSLGFPFDDVEYATETIVRYATQRPLNAIIAVDDSGSLLAAHAGAALTLPHNSYDAALAARNKYRMRTLLEQAGVPIPEFRLCSTDDDVYALAEQVVYPCVVKPLDLNGSRGVIRANTPAEFVIAAERLTRMLAEFTPAGAPSPFLVERFIPGVEVALEGLLNHGDLYPLALFDKPDPLDGPFFEETIYVTPSRLPQPEQQMIVECAAAAAAALGLREGPMHAELRINENGPWLIEVAGRSIGGLCSQTLRFGTDASLEELILRQACGMEIESLRRAGQAGGVMMIPIPAAGLLRSVKGVAEAEAVPGVTEVVITAQLNYPIIPLPEGDSYLGFIFAQCETPDAVEAALRAAHRCLQFAIMPNVPLTLIR
jgi:biotin carboxylase